MPNRQDAINAAIEAAKSQKDLIEDVRRKVIPLLTSTEEIVENIRERGVRVRVKKFWPLCIDVTIK